MPLLRIGVLIGGRSQEREVSLNSGRTLCDHLDTSSYSVVPIFQKQDGNLYILPDHFLHRGKISDFEHRLAGEALHITWDELKDTVDFIYIAQHGRYAEDGSMQGFLEVLGIPYFGSKVLSSALGMNKIIQRSFLKAAGIAVPLSLVVQPSALHSPIDWPYGLPCIVKPAHEGSSLGVSVVTHLDDLPAALIKAATVTPGIQQEVLIEEYIQGMEFSCVVITDYLQNKLIALPPSEIVLNEGTFYFDYEQKYMPGKALKYTPARCTPNQQEQIQETCKQAMVALHMKSIARIDGFLTRDNRVVIIDPNTFSGMDPASFAFLQAAELGMSHTQLINHLIETELRAYGMLQAGL